MSRDAVQKVYDWFEHEYGFIRRSGDLFKESEQAVAVLDLQRSDYGRSYYLNVGFALRHLHDRSIGKFGLCDIQLRAESLMGGDGRLQELLDMEANLDEATREAELQRILGEKLLPLLEAGLTIEGLRNLERSGRLRQGLVRKEAREVIGDPSGPPAE